MDERVRYDLYYINNWSIWFDIKIIIKTILTFFSQKHAY
ncbi:MAG: sugar transferase [candidate division WOR-3 bacterium]